MPNSQFLWTFLICYVLQPLFAQNFEKCDLLPYWAGYRISGFTLLYLRLYPFPHLPTAVSLSLAQIDYISLAFLRLHVHSLTSPFSSFCISLQAVKLVLAFILNLEAVDHCAFISLCMSIKLQNCTKLQSSTESSKNHWLRGQSYEFDRSGVKFRPHLSCGCGHVP